MAHVQAEVETPPIKEDDTHLAAVRRFPTAGRSTGQGVDPAKLNPRIHCRGTHRQEWLTPIHRAGPAVIADIRHIRNRTGPYFTFRSYGPVQTAPTLPSAA